MPILKLYMYIFLIFTRKPVYITVKSDKDKEYLVSGSRYRLMYPNGINTWTLKETVMARCSYILQYKFFLHSDDRVISCYLQRYYKSSSYWGNAMYIGTKYNFRHKVRNVIAMFLYDLRNNLNITKIEY